MARLITDRYTVDIERELWQWIVANDIASDRELNLVTDIAGYYEDTLTQVVFVRTGYRNYAQCIEDGYEPSVELNEYYEL